MSFVLWFVDVENATQVTFFCCRFFLVYFCKLSFEKCIVAEFRLPLIDPKPWACAGLYLWASQAKYHFRSKMCQFRRKINYKLPSLDYPPYYYCVWKSPQNISFSFFQKLPKHHFLSRNFFESVLSTKNGDFLVDF